MALLSDVERQQVWAAYMAELVPGELYTLTKQDLRAAVDAMDGWFNDNAASANAAMPQPARGALSQSQKARLLVKVLYARYITGS